MARAKRAKRVLTQFTDQDMDSMELAMDYTGECRSELIRRAVRQLVKAEIAEYNRLKAEKLFFEKKGGGDSHGVA